MKIVQEIKFILRTDRRAAANRRICAIGVRRKASLNSSNAALLLSQLDIYYLALE